MKWDAWRFSAKLAWQDRFIRGIGILTLVLFVCWTSFFLWRLIPEGLRSGVLVMHYNIYLGIDDVRPWPWIFVPPTIFFCMYLVDVVITAGIYRSDAIAARALITFPFIVGIIWAISSFYLILVNL